MNRTLRTTLLLTVAVALAACGEAHDLDNSYAAAEDDPSIFSTASKADGLTIEEGGAAAAAVLRVANELSLAELDDAVKLDARAARNIVEARETDGDFLTLRQLDDVKYVGIRAATRMLAWAEAQGWVEDADPADVTYIHGVAAGSYAALGILALANEADGVTLDDEVGLDSRAVAGIIADRPLADLKALDGARYVGARAFGKLFDYAAAHGLVPSCGDGAVQPGLEACDDGNLVDGDGCTAACEVEDIVGDRIHGVLVGSDDALAILRVANHAALEVLDDDAGLDARAAAKIVQVRDAEGDFADLAALDAVPYVGARAFGKLLDFAPRCGELCDPAEPADDAVVFEGPESCSGQGHGSNYTFAVVSNPPVARTDVRVAVRFNSSSPYSPIPHHVQLETGPDQWSTVFTTAPAVGGWQLQTFTFSAERANAAIEAMGWLRFRVNPGTAYTACSQLEVTYNCPECFACPEGQVDRGFGCELADAPYDQTLLDHSRGMCSRSSATLTFTSTPAAAGDGSLSLQFLPCDGGRINVSIRTQNAGWISLGDARTGLSCGFADARFAVPEAFLDAARSPSGEIEIRYNISDSCRPGMGCAGHNDPCVRRVNLSYDRE